MPNHDQLYLSRRRLLQAGALGLAGLGVGPMLSRFAFAQGGVQGAAPAPAAGRPPNIRPLGKIVLPQEMAAQRLGRTIEIAIVGTLS